LLHFSRSTFRTTRLSNPAHSDNAAYVIPGAWVAGVTLLSLVALIALMAWQGLRIDPWAKSTILFSTLGITAAATRYALRHAPTQGRRIARDIAEYFGLFTLISLMGATATYPLSAGSHGFIDPTLQRIDAMLRFNWIAWYDLVAAHRSLQLLGIAAYQSIFVTPVILLGYFAWRDHRAAARSFIASFWLAAVISLVLFRFIPAEGPLAFLWQGPIPYMPVSELSESTIIPELRLHLMSHVDLGNLRGLVSAPSFHTASAVLYIAAAWPFRRLRWPLTLLNVAMLLSTPVEGTHYLSDMIAGALVAIVGIVLVRLLEARRSSIGSSIRMMDSVMMRA
jgi:membrane-associated phospholipid phosphatase